MKRQREWKVSLRIKGKGEGLLAKLPSPSSFLHGKQGRRPRGAGGGRFGRPGPRRRPGVREKGARGTWGSIPRLTSGWGGAQRRGDGSGRRRLWWRVAAALALGRSGWRRRAGFGTRGCVSHGEEREEGRAQGAGARRVRDVRWQAELAKGAGEGKEEEREGEGRKENRKEKEKKMEKRKERKRRAGFAALPTLGRPRAAPGRASAARGSRETQGARYSVGSDSPGIGRLEQEGFREVRGRVFQGESSSTKNNFSARFNLVNFRDVTNLPHLK